MNCIAIDDEPIALSIISNFCQRIGGINLETFSDPLQGMEAVVEQRPDLVFLDIEMNDVSGLDLAAKLPRGTLLIFTTAHANYALEGFELNALDFLHKPFSFERFDRAVTKVLNIIRFKTKVLSNETTITLKVEYKNVTITTIEILYIEAMDNYMKVHTIDSRTILTQTSMKNLMELLPEGQFVRIHRSFVVNRSRIKSFTKKQVELNTTTPITLAVGRLYASELYQAME